MEHVPLAVIWDLTAEVITVVVDLLHFSGDVDMMRGLGDNFIYFAEITMIYNV